MNIKTAIIILISLFLILGIFLGYTFFIFKGGETKNEINVDNKSTLDEKKAEEKTEEIPEQFQEEVEILNPEESRNSIISNLIKEEKSEIETKEEIGVPQKTEEEIATEKEKKVNDIKNLLLK